MSALCWRLAKAAKAVQCAVEAVHVTRKKGASRCEKSVDAFQLDGVDSSNCFADLVSSVFLATSIVSVVNRLCSFSARRLPRSDLCKAGRVLN
jgi:hypothetical protein